MARIYKHFDFRDLKEALKYASLGGIAVKDYCTITHPHRDLLVITSDLKAMEVVRRRTRYKSGLEIKPGEGIFKGFWTMKLYSHAAKWAMEMCKRHFEKYDCGPDVTSTREARRIQKGS